MISGIVPFYEIVEAIKDETSISNIRPYYDKIRRLIFRAEREIGYGGSVILKKLTYKSDTPRKYLKFPEDFIEFEGIGIDCCRISPTKYTITSEGIRLKSDEIKNIVLLYWSIGVDEEGYPMVTRNHEEAVIAYIVWKLYSPKIFLGIGNMNAAFEYKRNFENLLLESRGDDAFPTLEEWNEIGQLSYTDRRILIELPAFSYSYCDDIEDVVTPPIVVPPTPEPDVYYWQVDNINDTITQVLPLVNPTFLDTKPKKVLSDFEDGVSIIYTEIGRICFAIYENDDANYIIKDILGNNVTSGFDSAYISADKIKLFVSKNFYTFSTINFKIEKQ